MFWFGLFWFVGLYLLLRVGLCCLCVCVIFLVGLDVGAAWRLRVTSGLVYFLGWLHACCVVVALLLAVCWWFGTDAVWVWYSVCVDLIIAVYSIVCCLLLACCVEVI